MLFRSTRSSFIKSVQLLEERDPVRFSHAIKVFPDQGVWWCETPKVGCSTVKGHLLAHLGVGWHGSGQGIHALANQVLESPVKMGIIKFAEWLYDEKPRGYVFVREPSARLQSAYKDKILNNSGEQTELGFLRQAKRIAEWSAKRKNADLENIPSFHSFISWCTFADVERLNHHWAPQFDVCWFKYLPYTDIFPFEKLDYGIISLLQRLGASAEWIGQRIQVRRNVSRSQIDLWIEIDNKLKRKLMNRYRMDIRIHKNSLQKYMQGIDHEA